MITSEKISERVLAEELKKARMRFDAARKAGLVVGTFDGPFWEYKGIRLLFKEISEQRCRQESLCLTAKAGLIGRCYISVALVAQCSPELAVSRLNGFRWLAKVIGDKDELWVNLSTAILNKTVSVLKESTSIATTYHRATALTNFVDYLNSLHGKILGVDQRYCERFLRWKHGVPNPIRSSLEITSDLHALRQKEKYEPNLHVALAIARTRVKSDPSLEPSKGYDRLRLEPLSFALALGLRIGEVCALPVNAFERDTDTGMCFVRTPTEKGAIASATAAPQIWEDALGEAYTYLLEQCAEARARAREIENNNFDFIQRDLLAGRKIKALTIGQLTQLEVAGFEPDKYFFIDEFVKVFSLSKKEFSSDNRFRRCTRPLPKPVSARMVVWLDARFNNWDWLEISDKHMRKGEEPYISVLSIGRHYGGSVSPIRKAKWFVDDLKLFLAKMQEDGIFKTPTHDSSIQDVWRKKWVDMREKMLSNRGGSGSTVVSLDDFVADNARHYASFLSKHFKETFDWEGNAAGGGFLGKRVREGMEVKLSDHLIVVWEYQFAGNRTRGILPRPILRSDFYNYLCKNAQKKTIFERMQILDDEGVPYSFTPHVIRRWVTTALLRSGPSEAAIDMWMGRSPRQTRHYDYRTAKERAEFARDRYLTQGTEPNDVLGRKIRFWRQEGLSAEQIEVLVCEKLKVLHFTPWGACSRELYISPCTRGLMCLRGFGTSAACESFQIDLSDIQAKQAIVELREKYILMLTAIEPNYKKISEAIMLELNNDEPLDQHLKFIIDMIKGCDVALHSYDSNSLYGDV